MALELSKTKRQYDGSGITNLFATCLETLDKQAPRKQKYVRGNQSPFMNKTISKAIMDRSRLRNNYIRMSSEENKKLYNKQRNYCVSLIRKTKKEYYSNLNEKDITDCKRFWKTVKPFLSDKNVTSEKVTLVENDEVVTSDEKTSEILNTFFTNAVSKLNIPKYEDGDSLAGNISDKTIKAIVKYRNHPSIVAIRHKCKSSSFSFTRVQTEDIMKEINNLNNTKASLDTDIPTKIIKENSDIFVDFLKNSFNNSVDTNEFPSEMKLANITPVHKKGSKNFKENFRPISILPNVSKIFEKCLYKQMYSFFENKLSKYQCGFRKGYSAQHCLIIMLEKWKSTVDNGGRFGALLTDLSKAFDCLSHELLIAKLNAYGFSMPALRLIHDYLSNRKQRTKVNSVYSSWLEILLGVPQGSILGPLLFNIFLCDLFFIIDSIDFASYADDNTPYVTGESIEQVISSLEKSTTELFQWFKDNGMKANANKCHLLLSNNETSSIEIEGTKIVNSESEKLLGITFDSNLSFNLHLEETCKRASQKLNALARVSPYISVEKRKILFNAFFLSQFNYCPLVWMCHNRSYNNRINRLHERCLRTIYNDKQSSFEQLLDKDGSVSIHHKNVQFLLIEMFKIKNNIAPKILTEIFKLKPECRYNLRTANQFQVPKVKTTNFGSESLSYLGPKLWNELPSRLQDIESLTSFKKTIKKWVPISCPCRLCKNFVKNLGYI